MSVDLDKIQQVIETEVSKAIANERKRIVSILTTNNKDLLDLVKNGGEEAEEAPVKKAPPAKKEAAKKPAAKKPAPAKEEEPEEEAEELEEVDGSTYDLSEVEDDEVEESEYNDLAVGKLKAKCAELKVTVPKGYKKPELVKMLILHEEELEG